MPKVSEARKLTIEETFLVQLCKCGHRRITHFEEQPYICAVGDCGCESFEHYLSKARLAEAASHLRVALLQAHPDDDQIILEHVREALKLLEGI